MANPTTSLKPKMKKVGKYDWGVALLTKKSNNAAAELKQVLCEVGDSIRLSWGGDKWMLDILLLKSEADYVLCNTKDASGVAYQLAPLSSSGQVEFNCQNQGVYFLTSSHGCELGHKLRVQVTNMEKTKDLRAMFNTETGKHHYTYPMVAKEFLIPADFDGGFSSDETADEALKFLWCVTPHTPLSCSDWLPASVEENVCLALLESDIGY
ncbi:unnamed protein product, partial [Amoebophrya sp. A120]|eukprot:GSA120T00000416001.1